MLANAFISQRIHVHAEENYKPLSPSGNQGELTSPISLGSIAGLLLRGALSVPRNRGARPVTPAITIKSVFIVELERSLGFCTFSPQCEGPQSNWWSALKLNCIYSTRDISHSKGADAIQFVWHLMKRDVVHPGTPGTKTQEVGGKYDLLRTGSCWEKITFDSAFFTILLFSFFPGIRAGEFLTFLHLIIIEDILYPASEKVRVKI